ncbi:hypothetical protein EYF80_037893 [Liparis tanakae]|uniref:Uncharacterized protein n=1 Tax=Liparis tanakae TaxID=230148 RepID=A0A4Z2GGY1_9TELE|nr:hypothetical protein EYF80_037893 [Liparis tanakae]
MGSNETGIGSPIPPVSEVKSAGKTTPFFRRRVLELPPAYLTALFVLQRESAWEQNLLAWQMKNWFGGFLTPLQSTKSKRPGHNSVTRATDDSSSRVPGR